MTDQNTPASTLREAATRLRELAKDALPGPWACVEPYPDPDPGDMRYPVWTAKRQIPPADYQERLRKFTSAHPMCLASRWGVAEAEREPDQRWISLMSPSVAEPLAAWLEAEARAWPGAPRGGRFDALAFARAVLGETPCS